MNPDRRDALLRHVTQQLTETAASVGWAPDIDWFAADGDGHLGVFATAGLGPVPTPVLRDPRGLVAVLEAVETIRAVEFKPQGFVQAPASLGAFGFDYSGSGKRMGQYVARHPYERLAELPAEPLSIESLGADATEYLKGVLFSQLCFAESPEIVVEDAFADLHRPTRWDGPASLHDPGSR
jgi:hypothetical protein